MDSKKNRRPGGKQEHRQVRSDAGQKKAPPRREMRQSPQGHSGQAGVARPQSRPQRGQERQAHPRQEQENVARRHQAAAQNMEETVFRMDQSQRQDRRVPREPEEARRAKQRRRSADRVQQRRRQAKRPSRAPKVVYTQPRPFNGRRLLLQLGIVAAVVAAMMLGLSIFFKVDKVMVYGNKAYSAWTILETSGIETGERLLSINNARACGKIKTLPYVDEVRIGINLPDTVNIYIKEYDVVYAIQSQNDIWWLMTSDGQVTEQTDSGTANNYTKVLGVKLDSPVAGEQAKAYQEITNDPTSPTDGTDLITAAPVVTSAASQLQTALTILDTLEESGLVGEAASVDVTSISDITLWYGTRYQVRLGDTSQIDYKISAMKMSIAQLGEYETGILDVSFTTWADGPFYTPFE